MSLRAVPPSAACLLEIAMRAAWSSWQTSGRGKCLAMHGTGRGEGAADRVGKGSIPKEAEQEKGLSAR